jgi:hypothetical protein
LIDLTPQVLTALFSAGGSLIGVLAGLAFGHYLAKRMKIHEWQLQLLREQIAERRRAYSDLLACAHTISLEATVNPKTSVTSMTAINASFASVELLADANVIKAAKDVVDSVLAHFGNPADLDRRRFVVSKQTYIEAVRDELREHENRVLEKMT